MQLQIVGVFDYSTLATYLDSPQLRQLQEVDITSHVHSKRQARAEFERFLKATGLPETTRGDLEALDA